MKGLRNFTYATYIAIRTSYEMNPVLTIALGTVTVLFVLSIFGVI
ncbi:hypothetical protein [Klebsiella phage phiKp_21]|nr:hypothetical protein [Klebsiella phage phiKp_21]